MKIEGGYKAGFVNDEGEAVEYAKFYSKLFEEERGTQKNGKYAKGEKKGANSKD